MGREKRSWQRKAYADWFHKLATGTVARKRASQTIPLCRTQTNAACVRKNRALGTSIPNRITGTIALARCKPLPCPCYGGGARKLTMIEMQRFHRALNSSPKSGCSCLFHTTRNAMLITYSASEGEVRLLATWSSR